MRILVVGSGGREHALAWACARDGAEIICAPGNGGTAEMAENVGVAPTDAAAIVTLATARAVDLVVVGPDAALAAGVVDACTAAGIASFGPSAAAAQLETSKTFAKDVMRDAGIKTAAWVAATPTERKAALDFINERSGRCVVKADGLALGKGVTVCADVAAAEAALRECLDAGRFGAAGSLVIVEERLHGREVSVFALCDGERARLLPPACDYKRAYDGDGGPNTGGMGAYTPPLGIAVDALLDATAADVVQPCLDVMRARGMPFRGCLYVGLMLTDAGPRVLEFNARFGDPETQALMPLLDEDIVGLLHASARGDLEAGRVAMQAGASVCVVATTDTYPGAAASGAPITLPSTGAAGTFIFHAGTRRDGANLVVSGGRVINVVARGADLSEARERAYAAVACVDFAGVRYRHDIAADRTRVPRGDSS